MSNAAIEVAPNIWRVPTTPMDLVNSYLLRSPDGQLALVDTGIKGAPKRIVAAIEEIGGSVGDVTTILLTHAHADHAGGAKEMTDAVGRGTTVHEADAGYVRSGTGTELDASTRLGRILKRSQSSDPAPVERTLTDGEVLPIAGGLEVLHTPGHSPGHVSLLHRETGTFITGDAIWNMWSRRSWPVLAFCTNAALTKQTAHRLAETEYVTAAFTHGPHIADDGRESVRQFLRKPRGFPGLW
jgi:glyoxylase-like metal-dependent hydrolase (beta-lactamase superfamily II)